MSLIQVHLVAWYLSQTSVLRLLAVTVLTCLLNDWRNAKSHDANDDRLLEIDTLSSLLLPSVSLLIVVKLLYIVSLRLGTLLYSDSPRSFDLDLQQVQYIIGQGKLSILSKWTSCPNNNLPIFSVPRKNWFSTTIFRVGVTFLQFYARWTCNL
jgi:hypothetical protein